MTLQRSNGVRHSSESISRYLNDFARIVVLSDKGHTLNEMRIITGHSEQLIKQYLELKETLISDESIIRLEQLTARLSAEKKNDTERNTVIPEEHHGLIR